jgi:hypothetical protein
MKFWRLDILRQLLLIILIFVLVYEVALGIIIGHVNVKIIIYNYRRMIGLVILLLLKLILKNRLTIDK